MIIYSTRHDAALNAARRGSSILKVTRTMTKLLEKAFEEASRLPEEDQDAFAETLLSDLASEERWTELFVKSQDKLALLAKEALTQFNEGTTRPIEENSDFSHD